MQRKKELKIIKLLDDPKSLHQQKVILRAMVKNIPSDDEDNIVSYLENGKTLFLTPLAVFDYFGSEEKFISGASVCTDGTWFWREYLPYFIKTYHFVLPKEFVAHARKNNWKVPEISYEDEKILVSEYKKITELQKG